MSRLSLQTLRRPENEPDAVGERCRIRTDGPASKQRTASGTRDPNPSRRGLRPWPSSLTAARAPEPSNASHALTSDCSARAHARPAEIRRLHIVGTDQEEACVTLRVLETWAPERLRAVAENLRDYLRSAAHVATPTLRARPERPTWSSQPQGRPRPLRPPHNSRAGSDRFESEEGHKPAWPSSSIR
jgi:hypothetical protein